MTVRRPNLLARPAVRLGLFAVGAVASIALSTFLTGMALGLTGQASQILGVVLTNAVLCTLLIVLSRILLHSEGATLHVLGLVPNRQRFRELAFGFAVSTTLFLLVAVAQSASVGAPWEFQGMLGVRAALGGLAITVIFVLAEELLFRGVALRNLCALYGERSGVVASAVLFGAYHLVQSGDWAMGAVFRFLMPALGGLLFGWAALRSKGLALPLGLHLGGNWVQASLVGFAATDTGVHGPLHALWRIPITSADANAITAPDLLPHLPYAMALALASIATWRWLIHAKSLRDVA